jgi:hypothetical protein
MGYRKMWRITRLSDYRNIEIISLIMLTLTWSQYEIYDEVYLTVYICSWKPTSAGECLFYVTAQYHEISNGLNPVPGLVKCGNNESIKKTCKKCVGIFLDILIIISQTFPQENVLLFASQSIFSLV